ncbi:alpha/beta-type small acid-soluble spore protein [Bacillus sp. CDB3]|uniref:alpha/beta-type small acid-soluble spore protein n=1 Tax=Bacillus sp. CDB3 TaxID=360310 RepID=UPI0009D80693|nr:alpha/beta-type small acid-soluble spore protein [Bacillus sp. CDB3]OQR53348.1 spore protein [Bacillus sp. CDB3]
MVNNNSGIRHELVVRGAENIIDQMKYEIAQEFGVQIGADTTARANGSVGGEITKRLVAMAKQQLGGGINH